MWIAMEMRVLDTCEWDAHGKWDSRFIKMSKDLFPEEKAECCEDVIIKFKASIPIRSIFL